MKKTSTNKADVIQLDDFRKHQVDQADECPFWYHYCIEIPALIQLHKIQNPHCPKCGEMEKENNNE